MIKNLLLIILFLLFFLFMAFYLGERKKNKNLNENIKTYAKQYFEEELKSEWQVYKEERRYELEKELNEGIRIEKQKEQEQLDFLRQEKNKKLKEIDEEIEQYRIKHKKQLDQYFEELNKNNYETVQQKLKEYQETLEKEKNATKEWIDLFKEEYQKNAEKELNIIQAELDEYNKKRKAINEDILRNREVQQQTDFYRVRLEKEDKLDIEFLSGVAKKIHHPDAINKLIWDIYIKRAVDILIKNVLNNETISGIYKFTNMDTGEIYIGKSTDVKKRTYEHYKYAFGLSGIASSQFHYALKKYGIDHFTFELLEKCDKDKLTEREKYYITFYESNKYGYNMRIG